MAPRRQTGLSPGIAPEDATRLRIVTDDKLDRPLKASKIEVRSDMTVAEGFTTIAVSCLRHFRLNEGLLVEKRMPEALHQVHVATRRLLSALRLFRPILRKGRTFERLEQELRWLSRHLGRGRDIDVLIALLREQGLDLSQLKRSREQRYDYLIVTLDSPRVVKLMTQVVRWLFAGKWRRRPDAQLPLESFVDWRIEKSWGRLAEKGPQLSQMGERERHRFRIRTKELRYALEFTRGLHRGTKDRRKRFSKALEGLQDQLGLLNDRMIARRLAIRSGLPTVQIEDREARSTILALAESEFAELVSIGPYWRRRDSLGGRKEPPLASEA